MEPLHPLLRAEIVRYVQLVPACYWAFDLDPRSKRYLNCKHGKKQMLQAVGMQAVSQSLGFLFSYCSAQFHLPFVLCSCCPHPPPAGTSEERVLPVEEGVAYRQVKPCYAAAMA